MISEDNPQGERRLAEAYGFGLSLGAEIAAQQTKPQPPAADAIDLTVEYRAERQSLVWIVEYGGSISAWSEISLQDAIGALALVQMEVEDLSHSVTEYGINFNGHNYKTQDDLGEAVLIYLSDRGYRFNAPTLAEPSLILCGLRHGDQAPVTEPNKQLQPALTSSTPVVSATDVDSGTLNITVAAGGKVLLNAPQQVWRGEQGELITALFAGKQMWVAVSSRGEAEAETFQLNYLDFKSEPLPSLQAAKQAAPAFARAVLEYMQSLITVAVPTSASQTEPQRVLVTQPHQQTTW